MDIHVRPGNSFKWELKWIFLQLRPVLSYSLLPYFFYLHRLTLIVLLQQYVSHTTRADVKVYCVWVPSSIASTFQGPDIIFIYYSIITHLIGCVTRIHFL